jgi:hypothetical protein
MSKRKVCAYRKLFNSALEQLGQDIVVGWNELNKAKTVRRLKVMSYNGTDTLYAPGVLLQLETMCKNTMGAAFIKMEYSKHAYGINLYVHNT